MTFDLTIPQGYIEFFTSYKGYLSEYIKVYLIEPEITKLECVLQKNEIKTSIVENKLEFEVPYVELEIKAKDQSGDNRYIEDNDISIYVIDGENPTKNEGVILYRNSYDEFGIKNEEFINGVVIEDTDSTGKFVNIDEQFYNGRFKINLDLNFIKDNDLLKKSVYLLVKSNNGVAECIEKLKFIQE